jgi:hypothetical protein
MFSIRKITQRYHLEQDRISFSVENVEQQVLLLWLTQRLANRLVGILVSWLDEDPKVVALDHALSHCLTSEQLPLQQTPQTQLTTVSSVETALAQTEALLNSIHLARDQQGAYVLTFNWTENSARLILNAIELHQWLCILYRLFDAAEWPKQAWSALFLVNDGMISTSPHLLH